jgi:hypothetical protein
MPVGRAVVSPVAAGTVGAVRYARIPSTGEVIAASLAASLVKMPLVIAPCPDSMARMPVSMLLSAAAVIGVVVAG